MTTPAKMPHATHSTPAAATPLTEKNPAATVPSIAATKSEAAQSDQIPVTASGFSLAFPLVITVAAIFPIAIGIGSAIVKASTSVKTDVLAPSKTSNSDSVSTPVSPSRSVDRRIGDRHFEERRFEVALQYYQSLGGSDPARLPPELSFRIALCHESLGQWDQALQHFRIISDTSAEPFFKNVATVAQARLLIRLRQPARAALLLRSLVFLSNGLKSLPEELSKEIEFLIPLAQTQEFVSKHRQDADRGGPPIVDDVLDWPLESNLRWIETPTLNLDEIADAAYAENDFICRVIRTANEPEIPTPIESLRVELRCHSQSLRSVLGRLADECGWNLELSDISKIRSLDRIVSLHAKDLPVCVLLTNISSELKATWSIDDHRLVLLRPDSNETHMRQMLSVTLQSVIAADSKHRLYRHAKFAHALLDQLAGDYSKAADEFSSLVSNDSSPLSIRSAYNAATNYFHENDYTHACRQLEFVVAGAPEHELSAEALILYGRLLLDIGETQNAVFQFRRAAEPSNRPADRARATALLGLALLAQDKYHEAAEVIFIHKKLFEDASVRNAAAFVTSYARWQALKAERQERESTFLYRSLLSVKPDSDWLGLTGKVFIGRAFSNLGFEDQMAEIYTQIPLQTVPKNISHEILFSLSEYEITRGHRAPAEKIWQELASEPEDLWANRARLKLVELAFADGKYAESLEKCRSLLNRIGIKTEEVKKLMGRIYEAMGDDTRAAKSYAGQIPAP